MPKVVNSIMPMRERLGGKKYKRPSDEMILSVMEKIGIPKDVIAEKEIEFLYEESSKPSPYFPGKFSLYKTTHLVSERIDEKGFRNRLRFKHLKWILEDTRKVIETNPNAVEVFSKRRDFVRDLLIELADKYREERIRDLLLKGRTVGYSQYRTSPSSAFEDYNLREEPLLISKEAQSLYSKFLKSLDSRYEVLDRLDFGDLGVIPFYRDKISFDLLCIHRRNLKEGKETKISKKDVEAVIRRRAGFIIGENEDLEELFLRREKLKD
jgi:hypothetical protein